MLVLFVPPFIFYADDVIIYMSDKRKNVRTLVQIFNSYALISGQHINPSKSKVHFGKNISNQFKNYAIHLTGFSEGGVPFTYLGTPIFRGAPKTDNFRKLSDEIVCKMNKWKGSTLSLAGRVCMVKSVIISSFLHVMKVYILPAAIITKVENAMRNFIWSGSVSSKGSSNVGWSKVCAPYAEGGLNMVSLRVLNRSILLQSLWSIFTSTCEGDVFIQRRLLNSRNKVKEHHTKSSIRTGLCLHWSYINDNSRWICGFPSSISFWFDKWLNYVIADRVGIPISLRRHFNYYVSDYFINGTWNIEYTFSNTFPEIVEDIRKHKLLDGYNDKRIWEKSLHGDLSSKLSYCLLSSHYPEVSWGSWIWQSFIPKCRSTTIWKAIHNRLLTWNRIRFWGVVGPSWCCLCHKSEEDIDHLFITCTFSNFLLSNICKIFGFTHLHYTDLNTFLLQAMLHKASDQVENAWCFVIVTYVWLIWHIRNFITFDGRSFNTCDIMTRFWSHMRELNHLPHGMVQHLDNTCALDAFRIFCRVKQEKQQLRVKWIPPQQGWIKCNTDASALGSPGMLKGGGLSRYKHGNFMGGFSAKLGIGFAFEGELAAALIAMEIAYERNWTKLWIESDSMYVVQMFNSLDPQVPWKCLEMLRFVRRHLSTIQWVVSHTYREANAAADCMASFDGTDTFHWWDAKPSWIDSFLYNDLHVEFVRT